MSIRFPPQPRACTRPRAAQSPITDSESGVAFVIAALMLLPCFLMAGFAIDLGRSLAVRTALQSAVDAATLAAAHAPAGQAEERAQAIFAANGHGSVLGVPEGRLQLPFTTSAGELRVVGAVPVPPTVMGLAISGTPDVRAAAVADTLATPAILKR